MSITVFDAVGKFSADTRNLDDFIAKLDRSLPDASQKSAVATKVLKDAQDGLKQSLKDLRAEGGDTAANWQKVADAQRQLAIASAGAKQSQDQLRKSIGDVKESTHEASGEAALLGEAFGIHLPRHVRTFLAEMPGVATALKAAFAVTAIGFLIEGFGEAIVKIEEVITALVGWDEAAKKAYDDQIKLNQVFIELANQKEEADVRAKERGLEGAQLTRQQIADNKQIVTLLGERLTKLQEEKNQTDAELRSQQSIGAAVKARIEGSSALIAREEDIQRLKATSKSLEEQITAATRERFSLDLQQGDKESQLRRQSLSEFIAAETAKTEAKRASTSAQIDLDIAQWRAEVADGLLSNQELVALEKQAEEDKYQNDLQALQRRLELQKLDPTKNKDAIIALNGQIEALEKTHDAQLLADYTEFVEQRKQLDAIIHGDPALKQFTVFNAQIEQAEKTHNAALLALASAGLKAIAQLRNQFLQDEKQDKFSVKTPDKITLSVDGQQLLDAVDLLAKLGDQTAETAKKAGEAQAAYDILLSTVEKGSRPALEAQTLLTDSVSDFGRAIRNLKANELLGLNEVIQQEIASNKAWGQSTDELDRKLKLVQAQLNGLGISLDHVNQGFVRGETFIDAWGKKISQSRQLTSTAQQTVESLSSALGDAFGSAVEQWVLGQEAFGKALEQALAQELAVIAAKSAAWGAYYTAWGIADLFWNPARAAGDFASAAEFFGLAAIAGAAAFAIKPSTNSSTSSSDATSGGASSSPATQSSPNPVTVTNVQHFATGGLISHPTLAVIGDSMRSASGAQREAAIPLDDPQAVEAIVEALGGANRGNTIVQVKGMISADNLTKVVKRINKGVNKGQVRLLSSNSLKVTKRT